MVYKYKRCLIIGRIKQEIKESELCYCPLCKRDLETLKLILGWLEE